MDSLSLESTISKKENQCLIVAFEMGLRERSLFMGGGLVFCDFGRALKFCTPLNSVYSNFVPPQLCVLKFCPPQLCVLKFWTIDIPSFVVLCWLCCVNVLWLVQVFVKCSSEWSWVHIQWIQSRVTENKNNKILKNTRLVII